MPSPTNTSASHSSTCSGTLDKKGMSQVLGSVLILVAKIQPQVFEQSQSKATGRHREAAGSDAS